MVTRISPRKRLKMYDLKISYDWKYNLDKSEVKQTNKSENTIISMNAFWCIQQQPISNFLAEILKKTISTNVFF